MQPYWVKRYLAFSLWQTSTYEMQFYPYQKSKTMLWFTSPLPPSAFCLRDLWPNQMWKQNKYPSDIFKCVLGARKLFFPIPPPRFHALVNIKKKKKSRRPAGLHGEAWDCPSITRGAIFTSKMIKVEMKPKRISRTVHLGGFCFARFASVQKPNRNGQRCPHWRTEKNAWTPTPHQNQEWDWSIKILSKLQSLEVDLPPPSVKKAGPRSMHSSNLQMRPESGQVSSCSKMWREHLLQEFENEVY